VGTFLLAGTWVEANIQIQSTVVQNQCPNTSVQWSLDHFRFGFFKDANPTKTKEENLSTHS
jgi:hypothetical protein